MRKAVRMILTAILLIAVFFLSYGLIEKPMVTAPNDLEYVYSIDTNNSDFILILSATASVYNHLFDPTAKFNPTDWHLYLIIGPTARDITNSSDGLLGLTAPTLRTVVILDTPPDDWRMTLSHELVHILQNSNGRRAALTTLEIEYEAEVISRVVYFKYRNILSERCLDMAKPLKGKELVEATLRLWYRRSPVEIK